MAGAAGATEGWEPERLRLIERAWARVDPSKLADTLTAMVEISSAVGEERPLAEWLVDRMTASGLDVQYQPLSETSGTAISWVRRAERWPCAAAVRAGRRGLAGGGRRTPSARWCPPRRSPSVGRRSPGGRWPWDLARAACLWVRRPATRPRWVTGWSVARRGGRGPRLRGDRQARIRRRLRRHVRPPQRLPHPQHDPHRIPAGAFLPRPPR